LRSQTTSQDKALAPLPTKYAKTENTDKSIGRKYIPKYLALKKYDMGVEEKTCFN